MLAIHIKKTYFNSILFHENSTDEKSQEIESRENIMFVEKTEASLYEIS
jgi:hypothetical protein